MAERVCSTEFDGTIDADPAFARLVRSDSEAAVLGPSVQVVDRDVGTT